MGIRSADRADGPGLWALNSLPNVGETADAEMPLGLPLPAGPPPAFPDLADVRTSFIDAGGAFLVVELDGHLVGMGGIRPNSAEQAEVLRLRVHPATRRQGIGRALMVGLEARARELGFLELHLDTATNQPEALAFYRGLGYREASQESRPDWSWTLVYFTRRL